MKQYIDTSKLISSPADISSMPYLPLYPMKNILFIGLLSLYLLPLSAQTLYGERLCNDPHYFCMSIRPGDTWNNLFPDLEQRDLVKRANRMNTPLKSNMRIAIPQHIEKVSFYDISPFPRQIAEIGEKVVYVNQKLLAFAAYDASGELIWWGPVSPGISNCQNSYEGCKTPVGSFNVVRKQDANCISTAFPVRKNGDNGGAAMPYCMHFLRGFALHGSQEVPGFPASHGCVRLFLEDARWLNEEFIDLPGGNSKGTRIIIDE